MRRGTVALFLLAICILVTLRGGSDVEDQAFVLTMGIDRDAEGMLHVTLQLPAAQEGNSNGGGSGETTEESNYQIIESKANTYIDALEIIRASTPREMNFSQLLQVIVSEDLAGEADFLKLLDSILTTKAIRQSAALVVCSGKASDFINAQKPFLGIRLSANIRTSLELHSEQGIIPLTELGKASRMMRYEGAWSDVLLTHASMNPNSNDQTVQDEGEELNTQPGMVSYIQEDTTQYLGAVVVADGRMAGSITGMEMQLITYMQGKTFEMTMYVDGSYYQVTERWPVSVSVDMSEPQWRLHVKGRIHARLITGNPVDAQRIQEVFGEYLLALLQKLQALGADPVGFEGKAIRSVSTLLEWSNIDWLTHYQTAAIEIETKVVNGEAL